MGVLRSSKDKLRGRAVELSKGATERQAENMLMAIEANRQEYLEVKMNPFT